MVLELACSAGADEQLDLQDHGRAARDALLGWHPDDETSLPTDVTAELSAIASDVSAESSSIQLHDSTRTRVVAIPVPRPISHAPPAHPETAIAEGRLLEINWDQGTAQLHRYGNRHIHLLFDARHADVMREFATQYVRVEGEGRFDADGTWRSLTVQTISSTRSWRRPDNLDDIRHQSDPKPFVGDEIVIAGDTFDVESFIQTIHRARDA